MMCQIVRGPQFQIFTFYCCFFAWSKAFKISPHKMLNICKPAPGGGPMYCEAKNEEKIKKVFFLFIRLETIFLNLF